MRCNTQSNILTIDLEDWYSDLNINKWESFQDFSRIIQNTNYLLDILKEKNIEATFFVLGYYAEKYPELIENILENNHEISTHGYSHTPLIEQNPKQFEDELLKSIRNLEKLTKEKILGFRAPFFSFIEKTSWVLDILKKAGLKYDSSIFPFKIYKYGVPDASIFPYYISSVNIKKNDPHGNFLEIPLSVYKIPLIKKNIPIAGGFYLRFFPYKFISYGIKKINQQNFPAVCYTHPWEFDLNHPRIKSIGWYNYYRLHVTEKKFKKLIKEFRFISIRKWMENEI